MGFILIKGFFHPDSGIPDGDSVRFKADDDSLFDRLRGRRVDFKPDGTVQLRYEGIDTVEKAAIQPLADASRKKNFELLGKLSDQSTAPLRGFILSRQPDAGGRPVSFAYAGEINESDGADVFIDAALARRSVNYQMVAAGYAYPMYYETLFMEIRRELSAAFLEARAARLELHKIDGTLSGVTLQRHADLATIPPIFPKLWRRLDTYMRSHPNLTDFKAWLASRASEKLSTMSDGRTAISFDNVIDVQGDTVRMLYSAEDMVFRPA